MGWIWKENPPVLTNQVAQYAINDNDRHAYNAEVARWIKEGWLTPCDQPKNGIIPMLATRQEVKNKVRPLLDFRELNMFVQSHTADCEVCPEALRKWRLTSKRLPTVACAAQSAEIPSRACRRAALSAYAVRIWFGFCAKNHVSCGEIYS